MGGWLKGFEMAMKKVRYGDCAVCGKAVVYQGARYCSPACEFKDKRRDDERSKEEDDTDREVQFAMVPA